MKLPIRIDYILFFAGLCLGVFGCIEIHFAATRVHPPVCGVLGYTLLAAGTVLFLAGTWMLARPGSAEGLDDSDLATAPGPTLVTAAIAHLGAHLRNGEALGTRLALVAAGTFLTALWISWLDGLHRLPIKDNPRAVLWGACMQLGITCFMWVAIKPVPQAVESGSGESRSERENRCPEKVP